MTAPIDTAALRAHWEAWARGEHRFTPSLMNRIPELLDALDASEAIRKSYIELNNDLDNALDAARAELTKAEDACRMTSKDWAVELHARMAAERENADLLAARANDDRDYRRMRPVVEAARALAQYPGGFGEDLEYLTEEERAIVNPFLAAVAAYQAGEKP